MGCDIHPYPEKLVDGKWVTAEPFVLSDWWYDRILDENRAGDKRDYKIISIEYKRMSNEEILEKYGNNPHLYWSGPWDDNFDLRGRNYAWFAILAGVRGQMHPMIAHDRGLPTDVSTEVLRQSTQIDDDGHSHSWVTLRELLEYKWDYYGISHRESVNKNQFLRFKTRKSTNEYFGYQHDTSEMVEISNEQMGRMCLGIYGTLDERKNYFTIIDWRETYRECVGEEYLQGIIDKLSEYGEPDEVRLVFWFDN